jgi:hypothetical protein
MGKYIWTPEEKAQVRTLRDRGLSWRAIQAETGIPQSTCRNIYKAGPQVDSIQPADITPGQSTPQPQIPQTPSSSPTDPIAFRHAKLSELESDIMQTRQRGQMQVLPTLHRLHINLHDEIRHLREEQQDTDDMSPDDLLASIVAAVHSLPPLLKHQLDKQLQAHNVVKLHTVKEGSA